MVLLYDIDLRGSPQNLLLSLTNPIKTLFGWSNMVFVFLVNNVLFFRIVRDPKLNIYFLPFFRRRKVKGKVDSSRIQMTPLEYLTE